MVRNRNETETFDFHSKTRSRPSHVSTRPRPRRLETTSRDRDYTPDTWCGLSAHLECRSEMYCMRRGKKIAISAPSHNFVRLYLHNYGTYRQSEKNLLHSNTSSTCPHNMVNFSPLTAEIGSGVWGTPANCNGFRILAALLNGTPVVRVARLCGIEQTAPPTFGRAAIMLGIGHILVLRYSTILAEN